jgi:hypothetical protein
MVTRARWLIRLCAALVLVGARVAATTSTSVAALPVSGQSARPCPVQTAPWTSPDPNVPTYHHPAQTTVHVPFAVDLRTISGWRWQLAAPLDETSLRLVSTQRERFLDERGAPLAGGAGETWTFEPLCEGSVTIALQYRDPLGRVYQYDVYDVAVASAE